MAYGSGAGDRIGEQSRHEVGRRYRMRWPGVVGRAGSRTNLVDGVGEQESPVRSGGLRPPPCEGGPDRRVRVRGEPGEQIGRYVVAFGEVSPYQPVRIVDESLVQLAGRATGVDNQGSPDRGIGVGSQPGDRAYRCRHEPRAALQVEVRSRHARKRSRSQW
ncbi:hypothetical protein ACWIF8_21765 [Micromonospora chalcea]